jgi:hypothetical protein
MKGAPLPTTARPPTGNTTTASKADSCGKVVAFTDQGLVLLADANE